MPVEAQQQSAVEIQDRMREIRGKLPGEVAGIVASARQLTDWKHYVRTFPWGSLAAAAAAGYMAIPRKLEVIRPSAEELLKLARREKLIIEPRHPAQEKPGLVESALQLTGNMLLRAGLAYMGQKAGKVFGHSAAVASEPTEGRQP
jgi:hypothetical protein